MSTEKDIKSILGAYQSSFIKKTYGEENNDSDLLMDVFKISPSLKRENKQYWGRELGKCWESIVIKVFQGLSHFEPALRIGADEPCDFRIGKYAIDTKYRVGSGDSGTLKKFKQYGPLLREHGYEPIFLFLREDNLPAAITACKKGGWTVLTGENSFKFIKNESGFDLKNYLTRLNGEYDVQR